MFSIKPTDSVIARRARAPDAAIFNDAICHPEQNSLLGATNLGLHSRSKCLRCGFSCIFFEVSDSLRGEAPSSAETTPLERSSIASSHFGSRRANGSLAANVGARSNTRFERLGALLPCQKRLLVRFSIDGYAEDFDLNALNIRVVSIGLRGKLMNFCNLINQGLESNAPAVFQSERDRSQQERQRKNHRNHEQRSLFLFFSL